MLKKILSPQTCAECRVCCVFDSNDIWEIPVISAELKSKLSNKAEFVERDGVCTFAMPFKEGEELVSCPMLTEGGCALGDDKPFDCKVWPFRVMRLDKSTVGITVSPVCEHISSLPLSRLSEFLQEGLAEEMFDKARLCPEIIKPYQDGYPILRIKNM